jgi:hypothetical protein
MINFYTQQNLKTICRDVMRHELNLSRQMKCCFSLPHDSFLAENKISYEWQISFWILHFFSYRHKMGDLSRIFRDQLVSPLDTAVYWTEYAARHQGAPHLQYPTRRHSFVKLLGLDFIVSIFFGLLLIKWMWKWGSTTQFVRRIDYIKNKGKKLRI